MEMVSFACGAIEKTKALGDVPEPRTLMLSNASGHSTADIKCTYWANVYFPLQADVCTQMCYYCARIQFRSISMILLGLKGKVGRN